MSSEMSARLYVVATPIGNLGDFSSRGIEILRSVDLILCEDTRYSRTLLSQHGITTRLQSCHEHNEKGRASQIVGLLEGGAKVALISDSGTPTISDPGFRIVSACIEAGIIVSPVPGANAAIAALSISGMPTDRFTFEGFLPPKGAKRIRRVEQILLSSCTCVVYESPHRILKLMKEVAERTPDRDLVVARELTKKFEEVLRGTASQLLKTIESRGGLKGEIVVLIKGV
ncbi:MAG: 16S rRNA (cytidine(1402)-2'-O)-methyltransferase, partial [Bdellovibrionales bacterium]|nr:16S rRNA (cytidine(1402)-2'-O)-methyltransferase [Bdellovibrionales bacterium]